MMKYFFYVTRKFFVGSLSIVLVGCAGMNSEFDCSMKPGIQCKSLGEINKMVDQGKIGQSYSSSDTEKIQRECELAGCNQSMPELAMSDGETMRIWVAPYTDESGSRHQSSMLYSALN